MNSMEWKVAAGFAGLAIVLIVIGLHETWRHRRAERRMRTTVEEQIHCVLADCGWYDDTRNRNEVP